MSAVIQPLLILAVLLAPFAVAIVLEHRANGGAPRWFAVPMAGRLCEDDPDLRRMQHDTDAIRTRFESGR